MATPMTPTRREFLGTSAALASSLAAPAFAQLKPEKPEPGERPERAEGVTVLNPRGRVPVSFIIDDSTCLVNLAHFCIPHFAEVYPDKFKQNWKKLPREIPDSFVREFGEWCGERGIKGKYSVVPYPACVGWVDRDMPGWNKKELTESVKLVRELMMPNWDIHPEMMTHTWAIDTKTGRTYEERDEDHLENWGFSQKKSTDELTTYMAYALRVLMNAGLECEGITTPGGFGNKNLARLSQASFQACRDVFRTEIPHYFRHLFAEGKESVAPRVEYAKGIDGAKPECVVSIIGCAGDWTGGWDGLERGSADLFITADGSHGRMVDVIQRGETAIMVAHWAGIYHNGDRDGFDIFKEVVKRLHAKFDHLLWMKNGEIARYWAAKELTGIARTEMGLKLHAPYACPQFTVKFKAPEAKGFTLTAGERRTELKEVAKPLDLKAGTWHRTKEGVTACFDLPKGGSALAGGGEAEGRAGRIDRWVKGDTTTLRYLMTPIVPIAKQFLLCDDVVGNPLTGKPQIVNLWEAVRVPVGAAWPYRLAKVCLFAWLRDGIGAIRFRFELIHLESQEIVTPPWVQDITIHNPLRSLYAKFLLQDVPFPEPGLYTLDVYWNGEFADDQLIRVLSSEEGP